MKNERCEKLDKITVELSNILEQIDELKEALQNEHEDLDAFTKEEEAGQKGQHVISYLENTEYSLHQSIDFLSAVRERI